mmetsp:Transcript_26271/g.40673  ORF Transcript_26271/g.40673 Transcript_26271/m.40673 type:complete len:143 (+) Transcript_26271:392-820(+)
MSFPRRYTMKQPVAGGTPLLPSTVHDPPSASKATPRTKGGGTRGSRLVRSPRKDPRSSMKDPRASSYGAISGASNRPLRIGLEVDSNDSDGASMSSISVATGSRRKGKKTVETRDLQDQWNKPYRCTGSVDRGPPLALGLFS